MDVGPAELMIVLVVALVLFGGKKIPELARSLGQAKNEFEKGVRGEPAAEPDQAAQPEAAAETTPAPAAEAAPVAGTESESETAVESTPAEASTTPI